MKKEDEKYELDVTKFGMPMAPMPATGGWQITPIVQREYPGSINLPLPRAPVPVVPVEVERTGAAGEAVTPPAARASGLADSGKRTTSITGGLREPKPVEDGRWDLIPAECVVRILDVEPIELGVLGDGEAVDDIWRFLSGDRDFDWLATFLRRVVELMGGMPSALHRLAVLYSRGAVKYADRNWQKGLPLGCYINSGLRHYKKHQCGQLDEDHLAAVVWNFCGLMWTMTRIEDGRLPRALDDYGLCK